MSIVWQISPKRSEAIVSVRADRLPSSVWGSNLRGMVPRSRWQQLSRMTSVRSEFCCEVCGRQGANGGALDCNEMWEFSSEGDVFIQSLVGVIALCEWCHLTQHTGRAAAVGRSEEVIDVLMDLNDWRRPVAEADVLSSIAEWRARSERDWDLDLAILQGWVEIPGFPALVIPGSERPRFGNSYSKAVGEVRPVVHGDPPDVVWHWTDRIRSVYGDDR